MLIQPKPLLIKFLECTLPVNILLARPRRDLTQTYVLIIVNSIQRILLTTSGYSVMLNSLLAVLNSRDLMRSKAASDSPVSIHLSRLDAIEGSNPRSRAVIEISSKSMRKSDGLDASSGSDVKMT